MLTRPQRRREREREEDREREDRFFDQSFCTLGFSLVHAVEFKLKFSSDNFGKLVIIVVRVDYLGEEVLSMYVLLGISCIDVDLSY